MNPVATLRLRRLTAVLGACWALLAIGLSFFALLQPRDELALPFNCSFVAGVAVVQWATPEATRVGVESGDRLIAIDGEPILHVIQAGSSFLHSGAPNRYSMEKRDGRRLEVALNPSPLESTDDPVQVLLHIGLLLVSILYLAVGAVVWWNKPDRAEAWAFLLFCSSMAVVLATAIRVELIPWSASRVLANLPLLGATTFHFFTSYPLEPVWIVRHRRIQLVPYALAGLIGFAVLSEKALGISPEWVTRIAFFFGVGLSLASLGILARERRRAREAGIGDRADVMLLAGVVSFLPALVVLVFEYFAQTPSPWYVAMMWVAFFPIAVGYGMLRKQLFEFRLVAKSSAAYGAATLAITGVFAFLITFADVVVSLVGLNVRSVQVAFLFLAILAFDPLRNRMQRLVDGIFDRDRSRYRVAVREISEAMVSMLSLREIGDRILVALTDTMGVERTMVLLFDESETRKSRPRSRPSTRSGSISG
jgi:hypothetical protein